jgi:hypothetical protein
MKSTKSSNKKLPKSTVKLPSNVIKEAKCSERVFFLSLSPGGFAKCYEGVNL